MNTTKTKAARTSWVVALALSAIAAHAQEKTPQAAQPAEPATTEDLSKRLEEARERLEKAAREVAELSARHAGPLMDRFMFFGEGRRAIIGVQVDPESGKDGARVQEVSPGGPAAAAGIKPGDVIVAIDGVSIAGRENGGRELVRRLREVEPDTKVKLRVLRDGKPREFDVTTRSRSLAVRALPRVHPMPGTPGVPAAPPAPGEPDFDFDFDFDFDPSRRAFSGMELASLTPKLGHYFGAEKGVLVIRAPRDEGLRLEDGDVIVSIDGREPKNGSHATRILRSYQAGEKLKLQIMRQRRAQTLEVTVPQTFERRVERERA
jgi:C-terminal processing protease CtpA/Prc